MTRRPEGARVLRTEIGAYEVATFPVPLPENYKPMLYPEFPHEVREDTRAPLSWDPLDISFGRLQWLDRLSEVNEPGFQ